jgi:hypothetical protein
MLWMMMMVMTLDFNSLTKNKKQIFKQKINKKQKININKK